MKKLDPEAIDKNLLIKYYIEDNLSSKECSNILKISNYFFFKCIKYYNIVKPKELTYFMIERHNKEKYGVSNVWQLEETKNKISKTKLEVHGDPNWNNTEKAKSTRYERYDGKYQDSDKIRQYNLEHFGYDWKINTEEVRNTIKQNNLSKYGQEYTINLPEVREQVKTTNLKKLGVENPFQLGVGNKQCQFIKDNVIFDSSWELALWIYAKDHNEEIEREPLRLKYEANNKVHYYKPDFMYLGNLIEIKGDYLVDSEGKLIDFYGKGKNDLVYKAKNKCIIDNNVLIWTRRELEPILNYCRSKYGNKFYEKFRR